MGQVAIAASPDALRLKLDGRRPSPLDLSFGLTLPVGQITLPCIHRVISAITFV